MSDQSEKICFVIAPIGDEESGTRTRSDQVLKHVIRPAAEECRYKTIRADEISEPGIITSQVIWHIVDDPLVIADLTEHNPNVFYELALRHALRKPFIHIIESSEGIPFDIAMTRTIRFDHHDLDSADAARQQIIQQIRAIEAHPSDIETPISLALDVQMLRQSDNPLEKSSAEIIAMLQELRGEVDQIAAKLGIPRLGTIPLGEFVVLLRRWQELLQADEEEKPPAEKLKETHAMVNFLRSLYDPNYKW